MFSKVKQMAANTSPTKRSAEEAQLTKESVSPVKKAKQAKGPYMPTEFDAMDGKAVSIVVEKDRSGELIPKVKIAGNEESKYAAQFNTPLLTVQYNDLKVGGDTGKFGKDETTYGYNIKSVRGLPDKVTVAMPQEEERQQAFMQWVENTCKDLLTKAFETKGCMENHKKKAVKAAKKKGTDSLTEFINGATLSMLKEFTDQDGDEQEMFVSKRRGRSKNEEGEFVDNRPVFWKRTASGWEKMDVKYITQGSVLKYQIGFRVYTTPNMYGVSCDLGKNIVVFYQVKKASSGSNTNEPNLPFIEFREK